MGWRLLKTVVMGVVAVIAFAFPARATPIYYSDRPSFLAAVGQSITEDYTAYGAPSVALTNSAMTAVLGETRYETLSSMT